MNTLIVGMPSKVVPTWIFSWTHTMANFCKSRHQHVAGHQTLTFLTGRTVATLDGAESFVLLGMRPCPIFLVLGFPNEVTAKRVDFMKHPFLLCSNHGGL
jgi:hypothetical protein